MEQSVSNSIFIPNGKGTKSLNGTESASDPQLITRRSKVQILPPQPHCATQKDIAPENPEAATVSGFFRVHF